MSNNAYIVSAVRTAGGKKNGSLSQWHPADLGAKVLNELVHQTSIDPELIDDVVFGCVDQVGAQSGNCLLYTSPSPRDLSTSRMPSSA